MTTEVQKSPHSSEQGFTMPELLIVVLIGLIITTVALPNMLTVVANARMRGNISTLSGALQNCRMMAVKENRVMTTRFQTLPKGIMAYLKLASDSSAPIKTDPQVQLEAPIVKFTTPTGTGAPSAVDNTILGFTPATGDTSFNTRGLPCAYSSGNCTTQGFIYYFKDTRRSGGDGWGAVSVSPAGRIKKWFWNGTAWGE